MILYTIDDLHFSINDIHEQWDEGRLHYDEAEELLLKCCKAFIESAKKETSNEKN
jgi:hypothetical protein